MAEYSTRIEEIVKSHGRAHLDQMIKMGAVNQCYFMGNRMSFEVEWYGIDLNAPPPIASNWVGQ